MLLYKAKKKGDTMKKNKIGVLDISQINGRHTLEIFKNSSAAKQTDLATLLGGNNSYNVTRDKRVYPDCVVNDDGRIYEYNCYNLIGIRPTIPFSKIVNQVFNRHINEDGILEVEYGYYPQNIINSDILDKFPFANYDNGNLSENRYTVSWFEDFYEHKNKNIRYIIFRDSKEKKYHEKLSDGSKVEPGKTYFIKIEPIKWLVDMKSGLAVSKYILIYDKYFNFDEALLDFSYQIMQIKPKEYRIFSKEVETSPITNKKTDEVSKIIAEINKYAKYYHGKIDIDVKVTKLITEYNNKVNNLLSNNNNILTLDNNDKDSLYLKLLANLNEILDGLKLNYENNKVYHNILELLDNCLLIIENKDKEPKTELEKDLKTITNIIIPYLNDNYSLSKLKEIFISEKINITMSLENMANLSSKISGKYKSIIDFELSIRIKLQVFLMDIYKNIIDRDISNEIIKNYKDIASNNYKESSYSIVKVYLNTLNELSEYIKKNGNQDEINELNTILSHINTENDLNTTINDLIKVLKSLYMIKFKIDERLNNAKLIEEYTISIPKVKTRSI